MIAEQREKRQRLYALQGVWNSDTLWSKFEHHSAARPHDIAVVDRDGRRTTFDELHDLALRIAGFLNSRGIKQGDVIAIQLPNQMEAVAVALGAQALGCVINPLLPNYREKELAFMFARVRPKAVFTPSIYRRHDYPRMIASVREAVPQVSFVHICVDGGGGDVEFASIAELPGIGTPLPGIDPQATSEIIFSSGTEAQPKAILHSEQTTNFAVRNIRDHLGLTSDDVVWMPSPIGHSTGFNYGLRLAMFLGLKLVLQDAWDPHAALKLINDEDVTFTLAATTFLQDLLDEAKKNHAALSTLRLFGCGGAAIPSDLIGRAASVGICVLRLYGSTELLAATWHKPGTALADRASSDGSIMAHTDVEIRDDNDGKCPDGTVGEILVRSPSCALGYFEDPERTMATFSADGWVRTGDLGRLDGEFLTVTGRKKEIIIRGGINIAPAEIEEMMLAMPEIERVAVVGIPHPRMGELACACIVPAPGQELAFNIIVSRLREDGLAAYKLPEAIAIFEELPMTASGKVQKHRLVEQIRDWNGEDRARRLQGRDGLN